MKTRRPISINNSLVHGICNYNCRLCGVNKDTYRGPKAFQSAMVTGTLIARVRDAALAGCRVRYIANAGDGEPTLHPEFASRMDLFGQMISDWDVEDVSAPEVSVVTNGSRLTVPGILAAVCRSGMTLIVSFPSIVPEAYGTAVTGVPEKGAALLQNVLPGIESAMAAAADGRLSRLQFHMAPPERDLVRSSFGATVEHLAGMASAKGLDRIELVMFPATSNRTGLIRNATKGMDLYRDLFRQYNTRLLRGVRVDMKLSFQRFFPRIAEFADLLRSFSYPCVWNSQLFLTADGMSICCNDQSVRNPFGSIMQESIVRLMESKEAYLPGAVCRGCDQAPQHMEGSPAVALFRFFAARKLRDSLRTVSARTGVPAPAIPASGGTE